MSNHLYTARSHADTDVTWDWEQMTYDYHGVDTSQVYPIRWNTKENRLEYLCENGEWATPSNSFFSEANAAYTKYVNDLIDDIILK